MSYDIYLNTPSGDVARVALHREGGTYALDGDDTASLNVTYNYSRHFDFRGLDGRTAADTLPELRNAVERLGTDEDVDYWASTPGNAGYACSVLLGWAEQHPSAQWEVR